MRGRRQQRRGWRTIAESRQSAGGKGRQPPYAASFALLGRGNRTWKQPSPVGRATQEACGRGQIAQFGKELLDRGLQVARAGQQAKLVEHACHRARAVRADAGHRFQTGKIGIGKRVRQIAERPVPRCFQALP